jgi:hypothetical protein
VKSIGILECPSILVETSEIQASKEEKNDEGQWVMISPGGRE